MKNKFLLWLFNNLRNYLVKNFDEHGVKFPSIAKYPNLNFYMFSDSWVKWYESIGLMEYQKWYSNNQMIERKRQVQENNARLVEEQNKRMRQ